jgi:Zn-dependent peptidase ImmA (M78 family)
MLVPADRLVRVNAQDPPARQRFTLGHELGHWVCQCLKGRKATTYCRAEDVSAEADRTLEREANIFAAELLMPEGAVRDLADDPKAWLRFGVSAEAMRWRLHSFDLAPRPR